LSAINNQTTTAAAVVQEKISGQLSRSKQERGRERD